VPYWCTMHDPNSKKVYITKSNILKLALAPLAHENRPEITLYNRHFKAGKVELDWQDVCGKMLRLLNQLACIKSKKMQRVMHA